MADNDVTRIVITDAEMVGTINKYAKQTGLEPGEAALKMLGVAKSRLNALRAYAKKQAEMGELAPRKASAVVAELA